MPFTTKEPTFVDFDMALDLEIKRTSNDEAEGQSEDSAVAEQETELTDSKLKSGPKYKTTHKRFQKHFGIDFFDDKDLQ